MEHNKRKSPRIPCYDYSSNNYYFITICTHEKKCIFGYPDNLSKFGLIAKQCLQEIPSIYPEVKMDKYVVMPNHIHAIVILEGSDNHTLSRIIGQYKMSVTKKIRQMSPNRPVWQRSFHDHIIRNEEGYEKIWLYIDQNPLKWEEDCFYCELYKSKRKREGHCPSPTVRNRRY